MFDRIRKALGREARPAAAAQEPQAHRGHDSFSGWAASRGLGATQVPLSGAVSVHGKVGGRPWKMEVGRPTRDYIRGEELRARAELGLDPDVAAMVIQRPLKESLERRAYSMITDTLQTTASPDLPEEMRWLAMYDELGWEGVDDAFWSRYAVLSDAREHAQAWVDQPLVDALLRWPDPATPAQAPFLLVLLRGKCYLRMQYLPADPATADHACTVLMRACEGALSAFSRR